MYFTVLAIFETLRFSRRFARLAVCAGKSSSEPTSDDERSFSNVTKLEVESSPVNRPVYINTA